MTKKVNFMLCVLHHDKKNFGEKNGMDKPEEDAEGEMTRNENPKLTWFKSHSVS